MQRRSSFENNGTIVGATCDERPGNFPFLQREKLRERGRQCKKRQHNGVTGGLKTQKINKLNWGFNLARKRR